MCGASQAVAEAISCAQEQQEEGPDAPSFGLVNETLPQPVWILMGGDSSQRQASLASGLNAWMSLRHQADYQVCPKIDLTGLNDSCSSDLVLAWLSCCMNCTSPHYREDRRVGTQMQE